MQSQPGQQGNVIYILAKILRSKANQTIKFDQFIEYNMKTFFLKNRAQNVMEKLVPDCSQEIKSECMSGSIV